MDVFSLLSYINKVSLVAFFITTVVVAYQIYNLRKEKTKEQTPIIPDFKEKNNFNVVANYTNLPSSLTKKELKSVNYSKLVFFTISLLTIIVVIFVVSLIKKNNTTQNQTLNDLAPVNTKSKEVQTPTPKNKLRPSPIADIVPTNITPTDVLPTNIVPTVNSQPTIQPTEIILAINPSLTPEVSLTETAVSIPQVLPETGSWGKGLLIIGAAISTIFFSFWF